MSPCEHPIIAVMIKSALDSAHPETVFLSDLCVMLKILSSEYQLYACINYMPAVKFFAGLDLEQKSSFLGGH